jgi:hypothetical protein
VYVYQSVCLSIENIRILKVNGKDMTMATYEEGILALKSCPETVALAVQENYNKLNVMPSWSKRDTFFVRSLFSTNGNIGLNFSCGDILCVLDTIYEDQVGNWYACKLSETGHIIGEGCIPNIQRSELVFCCSVCVCVCIDNVFYVCFPVELQNFLIV